ncbi:fimbrial protein [Pseudomonas sp. S2_F03]
MKKFVKVSLAASVAGVTLFGAVSAFAASSAILITGKVEDAICNIEATGNASGNSLVLPTVFKTQLNTAGATAGATGFQFALSGCPATGSVSAYFESSNVDPATGNLLNRAVAGTAAENVQVQVLNADGEVIDLNTNTNNVPVALDASGNGSLSYSAQYVAQGAAAGAGDVDTALVYTVRYQ